MRLVVAYFYPTAFRLLRVVLFLSGALLAISLFLFFSIRALPGDPVALRLKNPTPAQVEIERERLGLDRSLPVQYRRYLVRFLSGEWGESVRTGTSVADDVRQFLPATLELSLAALLLGVVLGGSLGFFSEVLGGIWFKRAAFAVGMTGLTVPIFWIGFLLLIVGSLWLGWFPPGGRTSPGMEPPGWSGFMALDLVLSGRWRDAGVALRHLALPAFCLSLLPAAQVCTTLRARLQDPRIRQLITALRARGLPPGRIWGIHALKLVGGPVVVVAGTNFGILLGGAVLTETVFSWPGMGRYLVSAVLERDVYVIQNVLLLIVAMVLAVVYASDMLAELMRAPVGDPEEGSGASGAEARHS